MNRPSLFWLARGGRGGRPTGANGCVRDDDLREACQLCNLSLNAGYCCRVGGVVHSLIAEFMLDDSEATVYIVAKIVHLTHGEGVGITKLDLGLKFCNASTLRSLVAIHEVILVASASSGRSVAEETAKTSAKNLKTERTDTDTESRATDSSRCIMVFVLHS